MGALKMNRDFVDPPALVPSDVNWRGRSGTFYPSVARRLDSFALSGGELYLLAHGSRVLWVGSVSELVADGDNRERFRQAMIDADGVYSMQCPNDEGARLTLAWDLEGAERMGGLSLA